ncbi:hypothetical protein A359_05720 [secondary endosymbiont of Ctenarytaina eucalypti]|uniref:Uncharacterized protein n=1 Tax=secondary endosymbiont of Ctenarytaina eucalypti TaxID=1199245 RepID=J3Z3Z0_9ENTR|nr:hypothetical protein A359_05720 [secondary endosymbiont of Ctenarytaina eucalypti]
MFFSDFSHSVRRYFVLYLEGAARCKMVGIGDIDTYYRESIPERVRCCFFKGGGFT